MDRVSIDKLESMARAELYAFRIAVAQVALEYLLKSRMIRDVAERACVLAHLAADALVVIDDNCIELVAGDGFNRAYLHAGRLFALQAHHRNGYSGFLILEYMYIGILRVELTIVAE